MLIEKEAAEKEVREWLKKIRISAKVIELRAPFIELLAESVSEGLIVLNDDGTVTQLLINKMGDSTKEVKYDPRYEIGKYHANTKDVALDDGTGKVIAILATLSNPTLPKAFFAKMSREDFAVADKLTVFF